ncbi:hypothetical protein CDIV41_320179 [Carnobacterium divergens]|nr:hypothetical protein CDIV41_320179 [Carnobacterium divergens]
MINFLYTLGIIFSIYLMNISINDTSTNLRRKSKKIALVLLIIFIVLFLISLLSNA